MIGFLFALYVPKLFAFIVLGLHNLTALFEHQDSSASHALFLMHVTTYDFFYKLSNNDFGNDENLPKFPLYGFVIFDPIEHVELKKNLEDNL